MTFSRGIGRSLCVVTESGLASTPLLFNKWPHLFKILLNYYGAVFVMPLVTCYKTVPFPYVLRNWTRQTAGQLLFPTSNIKVKTSNLVYDYIYKISHIFIPYFYSIISLVYAAAGTLEFPHCGTIKQILFYSIQKSHLLIQELQSISSSKCCSSSWMNTIVLLLSFRYWQARKERQIRWTASICWSHFTPLYSLYF